MKETVQVNIGSVAFTIDRDACGVLRRYLDDIASRLPADDTETLGDIERRIAEMLRERVSSPMRVVSLDMVHSAMMRMGVPADFGTRRGDARSQQEEPSRRLYRSRTDRSIAGVCGGLAEFFGSDPTLLRLLTLLLILFGGLSIWVYIVLWIIVPEAPAPKFNLKNDKHR